MDNSLWYQVDSLSVHLNTLSDKWQGWRPYHSESRPHFSGKAEAGSRVELLTGNTWSRQRIAMGLGLSSSSKHSRMAPMIIR